MVGPSETFELLRVLVSGGVATAVVVQVGQVMLQWRRGKDRVVEIEATRDAELAKIKAASEAKIAEIRANGLVQLQLERERNRALASSTLSLGPPPA